MVFKIWSEAYTRQLEIWIEVMEDEEQEASLLHNLPLSVYMQESWKLGRSG